MSYYAIKFEHLRQEKSMAELLDALERGFQKFGIDYYLVGALARDVWMRGIKDIKPRRATSDIDFGVLIKDTGTFDDLKTYLTTQEKFVPYKENAFVLIWENGMQVDLLPFGKIEQEGKVTVKGTGFTTMHVDGFKEVYAEGLPQMELDGRNPFKFCTLPGIVILKLIAWDDRPEVRRDDIIDISDILNHFFTIFDEMIWNDHSDLFADEAELIEISAHVLGREMGKIVDHSPKLKDRILAILDNNKRIAGIMTTYFDNEEEANLNLLKKIKSGIEENSK